MNKKDFQIIIMVKNSGPILKSVIKSWTKLTDNFVILDTGSTDGTQNLIKSIKGINLTFGQTNFVDFETSRNESLSLAYSTKCKYSLVIDDSYFCVCSKPVLFYKELDFINFNCHKLIGVEILSPDNHTYISSRLVDNSSRFFYKGKIHELIDGETTYILKSCSIRDKYVKTQIKRTQERFLKYDIPILMSDITKSRNVYYLGTTYRMLYMGSLKIDADSKKITQENKNYYRLCVEWLLRRAMMDDNDNEEKFICYDYLGDLYYLHHNERQAVIMYSKAGQIYPERAGEICYKLFLLTDNNEYLKIAKEYKLGQTRLQVSKDLYSKILKQKFLTKN